MAIDLDEIIGFIHDRVVAFTGKSPNSVDVDARLIEEIRLTGDDFSEIDYLLRMKYRVTTKNSDFPAEMSIRDWANLIFAKAAGSQT